MARIREKFKVAQYGNFAALCVAVGITAFWWLDGWWRGVLGIARGDDWSYLRTAFDFAETGTLTLNGWVHMNFIGQALLALPVIRTIGENVMALQGVVGLFSIALLFLVYLLGRQILSGSVAFIPVFVVGLSPLFGKLTVSFMTDIPTAVFISASLLFGIQSLRGNRIRWSFVVLSLGAAFAAYSIREFGILVALPTLLVIGHRSLRQPRDLFRVAVYALLLGALAIGLFVWRSGLPNSVSNSHIGVGEWLAVVAGMLLVLGFLLSPITLTISIRRGFSRTVSHRGLSLFLGVLFAGLIAFLAGGEFVGNIIMAYGSTWTSVGEGVPTFPLIVDRIIRAVALLSVFVVSALFAAWFIAAPGIWSCRLRHAVRVNSGNPAHAILGFFVAILGGAYIAGALIVGSPLFDRYSLPLLGPMAALMLATFVRSNLISGTAVRAGQVIGLAIYGTVAFVYVDTAAQIDGARWEIAREVSANEGIAERYIDGGDPWFRYHQTGAGALGSQVAGRPWWTTFFPNAVVCRTIVLTTSQSAESYYGDSLLARTHDRFLGDPFTLTVYPGPDACPPQG